MILTREIVINSGFKPWSEQTGNYFYLDNLDHATVAFYCWGIMVISVHNEYKKQANITVQEFEEFYLEVTGEAFTLVIP
jgi:hypothetical protein